MSTSQRSKTEHISAHATRKFVIRPEDQDRFVLTESEVVKACQAFDKSSQCIHQFHALIEKLSQFVSVWHSRISQAVLTIRRNDILLVVVSTEVRRDEELSGHLTELEIEVANDESFSLLRFCALNLPHSSIDEVEQFLAPPQVDLVDVVSKANATR